VAGFNKGDIDPIGHGDGAVKADAHKLVQAGAHIRFGVDRLHGRLAVAAALLVDVLNVLLLDMAAVHEHEGAKVARRQRAPNVAVVAVFCQIGKIAAVIDVGVA